MSNHAHSDTEKGHSGGYQVGNNDPASYTPRPSRIANPAPAGLFSFASTTFLLSMYNVNTRGIHTTNAVLGMAIFGGGLVQLLAGMWEFPRGNVFGATAFSSYGAFWMSYSVLFIPGTGVMDAYVGKEAEFHNAVGMYLIVWFMVTFMFIAPVLRRSVAFTALLSFLALALLMLGIAEFTGNIMITRAGGGFGIITGLIAYYIGVSEMLSAEKSAFMRVPLGNFNQ
ncbi:GPR1/FUN34/yaaH family-domain-containing protein [Collybia nuda]|uniref:GPR1/FUN34/yaaH family-domain-containing protein n=1 Tax=Collybia nuda TaxID=64659 RepID=A0A9P6CKE4_9AGAR|nr:GPR1/FUN34/yaaH family-domain-containing protein [Collybia nuda]